MVPDLPQADPPAGAPAAGAAATLTVLGCDGSYPGPGGAASGYLVRTASVTIWVDAGSGTFANLQRWCEPGEVDAVVLSHEHPDHWGDLESFAVVCQYFLERQPAAVYAPPGLRQHCYCAESPALDWRVVEPSERLAVGDLLLSFGATDHGPPTLAVRFDRTDGSGGSLAFSADSGPDWSVEELGGGIGLFLCEATFTRDHEGVPGHLSGRQAGTMAAAAGVGRLMVTHRWPTVSASALEAEASEAFGGPVEQAEVDKVVRW